MTVVPDVLPQYQTSASSDSFILWRSRGPRSL